MTDGRTPDSASGPDRDAGRRPRSGTTRWLYVRVLLVQAVTLIALWLLQSTFG